MAHDLRATLTPKGWKHLRGLHGAPKMDELADWLTAHTGLPMQYRAELGERCLVIKAATITSGVLHLECQEIPVKMRRASVDPHGWETRHYDIQGEPPVWIQKPLLLGRPAVEDPEAP